MMIFFVCLFVSWYVDWLTAELTVQMGEYFSLIPLCMFGIYHQKYGGGKGTGIQIQGIGIVPDITFTFILALGIDTWDENK